MMVSATCAVHQIVKGRSMKDALSWSLLSDSLEWKAQHAIEIGFFCFQEETPFLLLYVGQGFLRASSPPPPAVSEREPLSRQLRKPVRATKATTGEEAEERPWEQERGAGGSQGTPGTQDATV